MISNIDSSPMPTVGDSPLSPLTVGMRTSSLRPRLKPVARISQLKLRPIINKIKAEESSFNNLKKINDQLIEQAHTQMRKSIELNIGSTNF